MRVASCGDDRRSIGTQVGRETKTTTICIAHDCDKQFVSPRSHLICLEIALGLFTYVEILQKMDLICVIP